MRRELAAVAIAMLCGACVQPAKQVGPGDPPLDGSWTGREDRSVTAFREWHLAIQPSNIQTMRMSRVVPGKGYYVNENAYRCDVSFIVTLDPIAARGGAHPRVALAVAGTNGDCADRRFTFYGVQLDARTLSGEVREGGGDFVQLALKKE